MLKSPTQRLHLLWIGAVGWYLVFPLQAQGSLDFDRDVSTLLQVQNEERQNEAVITRALGGPSWIRFW